MMRDNPKQLAKCFFTMGLANCFFTMGLVSVGDAPLVYFSSQVFFCMVSYWYSLVYFKLGVNDFFNFLEAFITSNLVLMKKSKKEMGQGQSQEEWEETKLNLCMRYIYRRYG